MARRGRFTRAPGSGALVHQPTRHPVDLRGGGIGGGDGGTGGGGGTGTITDGANVNTRGVGVFHATSGTTLTFRGIDSLSAFLSVVLDPTAATVDLDFDDAAFLAALPDFARRDLANTFLAPQTLNDVLDQRAIPDPGNPALNYMRLFVRETGGNLELVSRSPTGAECVLCSQPSGAGGTLLFNGIEP